MSESGTEAAKDPERRRNNMGDEAEEVDEDEPVKINNGLDRWGDPLPISGAAEPTLRFDLLGWHDHRFRIVSTPALHEDFDQDKGAHHGFTMQGVEAHFPFFCQRYGAHGVPLKDWGRNWYSRPPETRRRMWESVKDLVEFPNPTYREPRYTDGLHTARKIEEGLIDDNLSYTPCRRRFDPRFVDFVCDRDDDPVLFNAIARVAQWIREGGCEQRNKFLAVHKIKAKNRKRQTDTDEQEGQLDVPDECAHEGNFGA